jgi:O-antigen/teichoic acid export membrane protein
VPVCVTLMTLAEPLLHAWLGDRYGEGATALTILVSYWLLYGALVVTPGFLVGAGRAREVAIVMSSAAALNVVLALVLTPELGLEGPAVATAVAFVLAFPFLLRLGLRSGGVGLGELARVAWLPAYSLGALLAGALIAVRLAAEPTGLPAVTAAGLAGLIGYWLAYYAIVLDAGERALVRGLLRRS